MTDHAAILREFSDSFTPFSATWRALRDGADHIAALNRELDTLRAERFKLAGEVDRLTLGELEPIHGIIRALEGRRAVGNHPLALEVQTALETLRAQLASVPLRGGPTYVPALCVATVYWAQEGDARPCGKPAVALRDGAYYCEDHK